VDVVTKYQQNNRQICNIGMKLYSFLILKQF